MQMVRPETTSIILGKRGSGKSGLAYYLMEECASHHGLHMGVCNFPEDRLSLLPPSVRILSLDELGEFSDAVIVIDEGTTQIPAGQRQLEEFVKGAQALCRQRNQALVIIFHASNDVGTRILRGMDTLIFKYPSARQIQWGSKDAQTKAMLEEARALIGMRPNVGQEMREFSLVDCEDPEYHGLMRNGLPSFWSDELSRAWAGSRPKLCPSCGKPMKLEVGGVCAKCYKGTLEAKELRKVERKTYERALQRGDITITQARDGILSEEEK